MKPTDKINLYVIKSLDPCDDRLQNFTKHYKTFNGTLSAFLSLPEISYSDKIWVTARLFTHKQRILWSVNCAASVLYLFEKQNKRDKRPRNAINTAERYANGEATEQEIAAAHSAAYSAADAAAACSAAYAHSAAHSAAAASATQQQELSLIYLMEVLNHE